MISKLDNPEKGWFSRFFYSARRMAPSVKILLFIFLLPIVFCTGTLADVISWPTDQGWDPITVEDEVLEDYTNDGVLDRRYPHLDLVGGNDGFGSGYSAGYFNFIDDGSTPQTVDQLAIRLRISDIRQRRMSGAYQVYFDTDNDLSANYVLQLSTDNLGNSLGTVQLLSVSGTGPQDIQFNTVLWEGSFTDHARWTGTPTSDGSQFGGNDDYFLDFGIGWDVFSQQTGILAGDNFQIVVATSRQSNKLRGGDIAGTDEFRRFTFSDAIYSDNIPEPAVVTLVLAFGGGMIVIRRIFGR